MLKRLLIFLLLPTLFLSACGSGDNAAEDPTPEPDVDATVAAAVSATETAAPTDTPPPADTPTPEPEPSPTAAEQEGQALNLNEAGVAFLPEERNYATELVFRLTVEGETASELTIDGVSNANGDSSLTYNFSEVETVPTSAEVNFIEKDGTTYVTLPDGICVSTAMEDLPVSETVLNSGDIVLQPENMVAGQLQWNGMAEVNGVTTNEYLIDVDNIVADAGITNITSGVLNVAADGNYAVRLILEGSGDSELLAPGVTGDLYYELNLTPSETPFEVAVPDNCIGTGGLDVGAGDGDEGDTDGDEDTGDGGTDGEGAVEIVISQVSQSVAHTCSGGNVVVEGASNSITLSGNCNQLTVNSAGNTIEVDSAASIVVNGGGNTIIYGGSPEIVDNGLGNSFTQK